VGFENPTDSGVVIGVDVGSRVGVLETAATVGVCVGCMGTDVGEGEGVSVGCGVAVAVGVNASQFPVTSRDTENSSWVSSG
jgi:hypothetical protein